MLSHVALLDSCWESIETTGTRTIESFVHDPKLTNNKIHIFDRFNSNADNEIRINDFLQAGSLSGPVDLSTHNAQALCSARVNLAPATPWGE